MRWLENLTGGYSSSANVTSGTLVLSLPDAQSPVVWRMELGEIKEAAFEIQDTDNGNYILAMKKPETKPQQIASFDNKAKALKALMSTSRAMKQVQSAATIVANDDGSGSTVTVPQEKKSGQFIAGIIGVIILGALIFGLTQIGPKVQRSTTSSGSTSTNASPGAPGVPVSADDFLKNR